jgi:hypothetical protein
MMEAVCNIRLSLVARSEDKLVALAEDCREAGSPQVRYTNDMYTLHRKKRFTSFPSPAGMSLTKLPLGRNNSVMTSLFPPRESLVVTSRLETGNSRTFFYGVDEGKRKGGRDGMGLFRSATFDFYCKMCENVMWLYFR